MAYTAGSADAYNQDKFTADAVNADAVNESALEIQRKTEAEAANVQDARFIGYAEVLEVYNRRSDTEPLRDRRARALAFDPAQQSFAREDGYTGNAVADQSDYPAEPATAWTDAYTDAPDARPLDEPEAPVTAG